MFQRVLQVRERTLGADDPDTAKAMAALAEVLIKRGALAEAEGLLRGALAVQERTLGAEHPDVGFTLWHLSDALRQAGRVGEAEQLARRMLELVESAFGDTHEWTAWGLSSLAQVRLEQASFTDAQNLAERAQAIFERHFGLQNAPGRCNATGTRARRAGARPAQPRAPVAGKDAGRCRRGRGACSKTPARTPNVFWRRRGSRARRDDLWIQGLESKRTLTTG